MLPLSSKCRWPWPEPPGSAFQALVLWPHLARLLFQRFSLSCCPRGWHSPKSSWKPLLSFFLPLFYVIITETVTSCADFSVSRRFACIITISSFLLFQSKSSFPLPSQTPLRASSLSSTAPLWALLHVFSFSLLKGHLFHFISFSHLVYGLGPAVLTDILLAPHVSF